MPQAYAGDAMYRNSTYCAGFGLLSDHPYKSCTAVDSPPGDILEVPEAADCLCMFDLQFFTLHVGHNACQLQYEGEGDCDGIPGSTYSHTSSKSVNDGWLRLTPLESMILYY